MVWQWVLPREREPYHGNYGECRHAISVNGWENTRHRCGRAHPDDGFRGGGRGCSSYKLPSKQLLGSLLAGLLDIPGSSITLLLLLLVYFILGFLLYASLFAAMGALVKRQEEVQNAVYCPCGVLIGYLISFFGMSNPNAMWVKVFSFIPFWTPTTMLMRIAIGSVTWWEIALSIVLMIVAVFICTVI